MRRLAIRLVLLILVAILSVANRVGQAADYDPLKVSDKVKSVSGTLLDKSRGREIPVRFYVPSSPGPHPVVLFSHGLGGSRDNNGYLGEHFAGRGYVCVFLQHPGSDESVWRGQRPAQIMPAMQKAASFENLTLRCDDVKAVVGQIPVWNREAGHPLSGLVDASRMGMSGHSFGAMTTQAVLGQTNAIVGSKYKVPELRAGIAYSPSIPAAGDPQKAFSAVDRPLLLMTGTDDDSPVGNQTPESRRKVFPALPESIDRYEVVLDGAKHSAFSEREPRLAASRGAARNPNHHRAILALSTAFWDSYLKDDAAAKSWLQNDGPKKTLEAADQWQYRAGKKKS